MVSRSLQLMLLCAWGLSNAQSFVQERISLAPRIRAAALHAEIIKKETVKFTGDLILTSEPLSGAKVEDVAEFFRRKECLDLLLGAGGTRPVTELTASPQLKKLWLEACANFESASSPEDGDPILSTDTIISMPGITLTNTVVNGVKLLEDKEGLPMYETVLIADKRTAQGPAPLVWIYNQLTGAGKTEDDGYSPPQARVMSRASIVEKNGELTFSINVLFQIVVEFPAILVRILPTSKEKMEEQGSASISKAIVKDVDLAIAALRKAVSDSPGSAS